MHAPLQPRRSPAANRGPVPPDPAPPTRPAQCPPARAWKDQARTRYTFRSVLPGTISASRTHVNSRRESSVGRDTATPPQVTASTFSPAVAPAPSPCMPSGTRSAAGADCTTGWLLSHALWASARTAELAALAEARAGAAPPAEAGGEAPTLPAEAGAPEPSSVPAQKVSISAGVPKICSNTSRPSRCKVANNS